jgi:L-iditol 2-dehydrogenase
MLLRCVPDGGMGRLYCVKACVLHGIGDLRYEEVPMPEPVSGEVRLKVCACGICGSDIPRVFEKGTYRFPLIPGHEFSGVVDKVGPQVDARLMGRLMAVYPLIPCRHCEQCAIGAVAQCENYDYLGSRRDGGFAEYVCAPAQNLVPVPPGLDMEEAALVEPAAVALHALGQSTPTTGSSVLIMGAGPIGLMLAMWARISGAKRVLLCDIDQAKLDFAKKQGFDLLCNPRVQGSVSNWLASAIGHGADLVIEASGSSASVEECMMAARTFGRVVLAGNPASEMAISQTAYSAILRKELKISGTWNSSPRTDWPLTLSFMAERRLKFSPLISHKVRLEQLPDAFRMMREKLEFFVKVMYVQ